MIVLAEQKPEKAIIEALKETHALYDRKISRGSQFKFMWLDVQRELEWAKIFSVKDYPAVIVLNPGKRKRYLIHEGEISTSSISKVFLGILIKSNFRGNFG